ncbi:MAG: methyltransferase domain-containing protein [Candidatus Aminicenantes bacterium]|nr:methyltransferase domain-containing protein [Candidatus Aminicenantes bacterium]
MVQKKILQEAFRSAGPAVNLYLRLKLKICPLLEVETHVPAGGHVVDLGCGNGLFAALLLLGSSARRVTGYDLDRSKLRVAERLRRRNGWERAEFHEADIVRMDPPRADVLTLIDVLYLIPRPGQEDVLRKCARALPRGGTLLVKEMDTRPRWKYAWNWFQETVSVRVVGFTLGRKFFFRPRREFETLLRSLGFSVETVPLDRGQIHPHILYVCRKV